MKNAFSASVLLAVLLAAFSSAASAGGAPAARIVSVSERKPLVRLTRFRGAGLNAFDEEPDVGDAGFSVRWYAAPPGAPEGTLLYAECMFDRSQMPRTFFAPQREATEGYRTSEITIPGAMIARYGRIVCWQVTLSYRGTVVDRWVSEAGWTPVGELPQVGMDAAASAPRAALPAPEAAPVHVRQRMSVVPGAQPVRQPPVAVPAAPVRQPAARPGQPAAQPAARPALAPAPARPAAKPAVAPSVPRRPADPDAPVGWSPASHPAPSAKPVPPKPVPARPAASQPVSARPVAARPVAAKPVASHPVAVKPASPKPVPAQPAVRPVGIRPSTPDAPAAPRSLP